MKSYIRDMDRSLIFTKSTGGGGGAVEEAIDLASKKHTAAVAAAAAAMGDAFLGHWIYCPCGSFHLRRLPHLATWVGWLWGFIPLLLKMLLPP